MRHRLNSIPTSEAKKMMPNDVFKFPTTDSDLGAIELRKFQSFIELNFASAALTEFIYT